MYYEQLIQLKNAIEIGDKDKIDDLLNKNKDLLKKTLEKEITFPNRTINNPSKYVVYPFHHAVICGNIEIVKLLINHGADIDLKTGGKRGAIHFAAMMGDIPMLDFLEEEGLSLKLKDFRGLTPLHFAALEGHLLLVQFLCEVKNANINATNKTGLTPLDYALPNFRNHPEVAEYLKSHAAIGKASPDLNLKIKELQKQVSALTQEKNQLKEENQKLQTQVTKLEGKVESLHEAFNAQKRVREEQSLPLVQKKTKLD
jgi:ankyrin repeat protein